VHTINSILILFLSSNQVTLFGQNSKAPTIPYLKKEFSKCESDSCRSNAHYNVAKAFMGVHVDSLLNYAEISREYAQDVSRKDIEFSSDLLKAIAYSRNRKFAQSDSIYNYLKTMFPYVPERLQKFVIGSLGSYYYRSEQYDSARVYYHKSLSSFKPNERDFHKSKSSLLVNMALMEMNVKNYDIALSYLKRSELHLDSISWNTQKDRILIYHNIGLIYNRTNDIASGKKYYKKAIHLADDYPNLKYSGVFNLAVLYYKAEEFDSLKIRMSELILHEDLLSKTTACRCNNLMADLFLTENKLDSAEIMNNRFLECIEKYKITEGKIDYYVNSGKIFQKKIEKRQALHNFAKAIEIDSELGSTQLIRRSDVLEQIIRLSIDLDDSKYLDKYFDSYVSSKDSLTNFIVNDEIQKWRIEYETEKKDLQNQILTSENQRKSQRIKAMGIGGSLIISLIGSLLALFWFRNTSLKQDQQLLQLSTEQLELTNKDLARQLHELKQRKVSEDLSDKENQKLTSDLSDDLKLTIPNKPDNITIQLNKVVYVKSDKNYVDIFVEGRDRPITYRATLKGFIAEWLPDEVFIQIHKGHVINKNFLEDYDKKEVLLMLNGEKKHLIVGNTYGENLQKRMV